MGMMGMFPGPMGMPGPVSVFLLEHMVPMLRRRVWEWAWVWVRSCPVFVLV